MTTVVTRHASLDRAFKRARVGVWTRVTFPCSFYDKTKVEQDYFLCRFFLKKFFRRSLSLFELSVASWRSRLLPKPVTNCRLASAFSLGGGRFFVSLTSM